jgi:hypothetical protein
MLLCSSLEFESSPPGWSISRFFLRMRGRQNRTFLPTLFLCQAYLDSTSQYTALVTSSQHILLFRYIRCKVFVVSRQWEQISASQRLIDSLSFQHGVTCSMRRCNRPDSDKHQDSQTQVVFVHWRQFLIKFAQNDLLTLENSAKTPCWRPRKYTWLFLLHHGYELLPQLFLRTLAFSIGHPRLNPLPKVHSLANGCL